MMCNRYEWICVCVFLSTPRESDASALKKKVEFINPTVKLSDDCLAGSCVSSFDTSRDWLSCRSVQCCLHNLGVGEMDGSKISNLESISTEIG